MIQDPADTAAKKKAKHPEISSNHDQDADLHLARMEAAFNSAPAGLAVFGTDLRYVRINEALAELNGIPAAEHVGKKVRDILPDIAEAADAIMQRVLDTGEPVINVLFSGTTKFQPGMIRHWNEHWFPLKNKDGQVIGVSAVVEEITERTKAQEALSASEKKFQLVMEQTPAILWTTDKDLHYTLSVGQGLQKLGFLPHEVEGRTMFEILQTNDLEHPAIASTYKALSGESSAYEIEFNEISYSVRIEPLLDAQGRIIGTIGICHDITERKLHEETLKQSEEQYKSLAENLPSVLMRYDRDCRVTYLSPVSESITGIPVGQFIGRTNREVGMPEHLCDLWEDGIRQVFRTGQSTRLEFGFPSEKGERTFYLKLVPEFDSEGRANQVLGISTEITERKQAEEELQKYRGHLEELVEKRTIELEEKNRALSEEIAERKKAEEEKRKAETQLMQSQKIEALGSFAGGIAHDLNNILSPIIINTEMLLDKASPGTEDYEIVRQTLEAAYRQRDLVKQILSFSRQGVQKTNPIKITPLLESTLAFIRSTLPSTIEIRSTFNAPADTVMGDSTQIQQILINLCKNAADALESQIGTIELSLSGVRLEENPAHPEMKPGEYLELAVQDTGRGIPLESIYRIFDPFFTTKTVGKGSGLGLSVVHGIVQKHGGAITVTSKEGEGSRFIVYLPLHDQGLGTCASGRVDEDTCRKKILLIDDEDVIIVTLDRALKRMGYDVVALRCALEALDLFVKDPEAFDLVITDLTMPRMTGKDLGKKIMGVRPDIPVILCTGFIDLISRQEAEGMGFTSLLVKPADMGELRSAVQQALES